MTEQMRSINYNVGDIIKFGKYEQDGNISNGKEDIEWIIFNVEEHRILVVSKYALDCIPYNNEDDGDTWEICTLRKWLNNDFYNTAFSDNEKKVIHSATIVNKDNPKWKWLPGITEKSYSTTDKVFCLSLEEAESYFGNYNWYDSEKMSGCNQNLICTPTKYAIDRGAYSYEINENNYSYYNEKYGYTSDIIGRIECYWWLRTTGYGPGETCCVVDYGQAGANWGCKVDYDYIAVRPALYIEY